MFSSVSILQGFIFQEVSKRKIQKSFKELGLDTSYFYQGKNRRLYVEIKMRVR